MHVYEKHSRIKIGLIYSLVFDIEQLLLRRSLEVKLPVLYDRPTNQPTNERTWGLIEKLHFQQQIQPYVMYVSENCTSLVNETLK